MKAGYDEIDYLRDSLTIEEIRTVDDIMENELEDIRDEITEVFYNLDISIDYSRDAIPVYQQFLDILDNFAKQINEIIDLEQKYIKGRLYNDED